jgi:hypothetical protein
MMPPLEKTVQAELAVMPPLELSLEPDAALLLCGMMQLILRHPGLTENHRLFAETMVSGCVNYFAPMPALSTLVAMGNNPEFDVKGPVREH